MQTPSRQFFRTTALSALLLIGIGHPLSSIADERATAARETGVWLVESGDSLWAVSTRMLAGESFQTQADFRAQVLEMNDSAFVNSDPDRLKLNARLTLPDSILNKSNATEITAVEDAEEIAVAPDPEPLPDPEPEPAAVVQAVEPDKPTAPEGKAVGKVVFARGQITAEYSNGSTRTLVRNSEIFQGDKITTPARGFGHLRFIDGALLAIRPSTQLAIESFNYNGTQDGSESSVLRLIRGGFRTITGAIGKVNKQNYRVNTVIATVGIRGTHYGLRLCDPSCELENGEQRSGLLGGIVDGTIDVSNESGKTRFGNDEYFSVASDTANPAAMIAPPGVIFDGGETTADSASDTGEAIDEQIARGSSPEASALLDDSIASIVRLINHQSNFGKEPSIGVGAVDSPTLPPPPEPPTEIPDVPG